MKEGDYIKFKDNQGESAEGVIVGFYESKAKHVVNRGGYVNMITVLKSDGKLSEMVIAEWHKFEIVSEVDV